MAWLVSAVRLLVIPLATLWILWPVPDTYHTMKLALLIAASAPIGANLVIYAQKAGADDTYSAKIVCLSTLLSMVTIPALTMLAKSLW